MRQREKNMAKYERTFYGNFDDVAALCDDAVMRSASASVEDCSEYFSGDVRVKTIVYERYSWFGGNRVSLSLTLVGHGEKIFLSAITAGGSQAVFFKINRVGEAAFLDTLIPSIDDYIRQQGG